MLDCIQENLESHIDICIATDYLHPFTVLENLFNKVQEEVNLKYIVLQKQKTLIK